MDKQQDPRSYSTGNTQYCVINYDEKAYSICVTESLCYLAEINTL